MKHSRLMILTILLTLVGSILADNLTVPSVVLNAGETKDVTINLNSSEKRYVAFQFDVVLPEGVSIAKKDNGKLKISLNADRINDHTLTVQDLGSGSYRLLCFSMTNAELYGTSGALLNMTLQADESASVGTKEGGIKSQVFTETNGSQVKWNDVLFNISITAAAIPEITADNKSRKYGEDNPELTYTTTATLIGVPQLTTTATKISPVGEYDIVVERGTVQGNYTSKNGKLTITKAPLTITAKSYIIKQGDALPTFEAEYTGFKNNETDVVLTKKPTLSTTATSASVPGTYEIIVSGAGATNYDITYAKGTLTITNAPLTISGRTYTIVQGGTMPEFTLDYSGFKNNETASVLTTLPTATTTATANSTPGEYPVTVSGGNAQNYNLSYTNGTLIILTKGDANGDGVVDTQDAIKVVQYYLGKNPTDFYTEAADVNNDGVVDTQDAIQIIKIYLKK